MTGLDDDRRIICLSCDQHGSVQKQMMRLGGYRCRACGHEWVEDLNDDSTWAIRVGSDHELQESPA